MAIGRNMVSAVGQRVLDDGFGNVWEKCEKPDCALEIVRPGKVQCDHDCCGWKNSDYPGCVACMERGTDVKMGEICPTCGDRSPSAKDRAKW